MSLETRRLRLQAELEEVLGSRNVYFQPPSSIHLNYPCIIYSYEDLSELHANGETYIQRDRYAVTLLTKDPLPDELITAIKSMPYTSFDRHYSSDNIHHFAFTRHMLERAANV